MEMSTPIGHTSRASLSNMQQLPSDKQLDFKLLLYKVIKKYCLENSLGGMGGLYLAYGLLYLGTFAH